MKQSNPGSGPFSQATLRDNRLTSAVSALIIKIGLVGCHWKGLGLQESKEKSQSCLPCKNDGKCTKCIQFS